MDGAVAQSVEQRTENPCVAGSIPAHTTKPPTSMSGVLVFEKKVIVKTFESVPPTRLGRPTPQNPDQNVLVFFWKGYWLREYLRVGCPTPKAS